MADAFVQVAPDSTGKKIDNSSMILSGQLVHRQRIAIGDDLGNLVDVISNALKVTIATPSTGTFSSVTSVTTATTILASNSLRKGATISNASVSSLHLLLSATGTVSLTTYSVVMLANSYFEVPFGYTGTIQGIWVTANGSAKVTELT